MIEDIDDIVVGNIYRTKHNDVAFVEEIIEDRFAHGGRHVLYRVLGIDKRGRSGWDYENPSGMDINYILSEWTKMGL